MANGFSGKRILVGVTGSIAAFKVAGWVSNLTKEEASIAVIMTDSAEKFITPLTFKALSGEFVHTNMFLDESSNGMSHIELGQEADVFVIAPATANIIAKLANGIADDLITTTALVTRAKILVFPAMNPAMYEHPATQLNLKKLEALGYTVVAPDFGVMACKDEGQGRLVEWETAKEVIHKSLVPQDLSDQKILVTAGPTREPLDPARFLSNRSSGKMGYALAQEAWRRGAEVTLVSGPTSLKPINGIETVYVETANEMKNAVDNFSSSSSIIVKAAAVSDFKPSDYHEEKVKKEDGADKIILSRNTDILYELGKKKVEGQVLIGFAAETSNHLEEGRKKLTKKNLDVIAVNSIAGTNTGFEADTNKLTLLDDNSKVELPLTTKEHTANLFWNHVLLKIQTGSLLPQ